MSMNLVCKEIRLYQTPTFISLMCYSNRQGGWKGILYRYVRWVCQQRQDAINANVSDAKEQNRIMKEYDAHLKYVEEETKKHDKLTFSVE